MKDNHMRVAEERITDLVEELENLGMSAGEALELVIDRAEMLKESLKLEGFKEENEEER